MRGIHTCRDGPSVPFTDAPPGFLPRAKPRGRPSVRPSSLPPPPTRLPKPRGRAVNRLCDCRAIDSARQEIDSNRESLRLEINVTQTKQTHDPHSNRELEALFQNPDQAARRANQKNSNRESLRLEIHPTDTQQRIPISSNREKEACF